MYSCASLSSTSSSSSFVCGRVDAELGRDDDVGSVASDILFVVSCGSVFESVLYFCWL
jgi:hypothetical protein